MAEKSDNSQPKKAGRPAGMTKLLAHRKKLEAEKLAEKERKRLEKKKAELAAAKEAHAEKMRLQQEKKKIEAEKAEIKKATPPGNKPGSKRPEGAGRQPGTKNVLSRDVKEMILGALSDAGGRKYLAKQAVKNPVAFMTLLGKLIPKDVAVTASGSTLNFSIEDKELSGEELRKELQERGLPTKLFIDEQIDILMSKKVSNDDPTTVRH